MPSSLRSATAHLLAPSAAWYATAVLAVRQLRCVCLGVARVASKNKCSTPVRDLTFGVTGAPQPLSAGQPQPDHAPHRLEDDRQVDFGTAKVPVAENNRRLANRILLQPVQPVRSLDLEQVPVRKQPVQSEEHTSELQSRQY